MAAPFALFPAAIDNDPIDYSDADGKKLYKQMITPLDDKFDGTAEQLYGFLNQVEDHARASNWANIINIPDAMNVPRNLITEYGRLTLANITTHAQTYNNNNNRAAQNASLMYQFLQASITRDARNKAILRRSDYMLQGTSPNGPLFLKVLILNSHTDNVATIAHIRLTLSKLDDKMQSLGSDIEKFNQFVKGQRASLSARGETTTDLIVNLFKAYESASDEQFVAYMRRKREDYYDGQIITPDGLMDLAVKKYSTMITSNEWNAPTEDQKKILALEAEIEKMKKKKMNPQKFKGKSKDNDNGKNDRKSNKNDATWGWKKTPPKDGQKTKKFRDKTYHWCPHHKLWCLHKPEDCKKGNEKNDKKHRKNPQANAATTNNNNQEPSIDLDQNLANMAEIGSFH